MVIEEEYDNYGGDYEEEESSGGETNPQWRTLSPKERKLLMKNVFSNPEWYDDSQGSPVFEGGSANPMFDEISDKAGAPVREENTVHCFLRWCLLCLLRNRLWFLCLVRCSDSALSIWVVFWVVITRWNIASSRSCCR